MKSDPLILGIDPGTIVTGFGIIRKTSRGLQVVDYGCIRPTKSKPLPLRYKQIYEGMGQILEKYSVDAVAFETQFVKENVATALKLGMARGVAMLAATMRGIEVFEYTPMVAKRAVVGRGSATKGQVGAMVKALLSLKEIPQPEDASDALAIAICHAHTTTRRGIPCMNS